MGRVTLVAGQVLALMIVFLAPPRADAATFAPPSTTPRAAEPCGTPGAPTTTVYLPNITKTLGGPTGWVTPFIVQNIGTKATALEVSFYRFSDGALIVCRKVPGLAPGTSFADIPNNDPDLPQDTQFSVVVRSFGAPVVSVVNEHQNEAIPPRAEALSYVGLTSGATNVYLPFVGKLETAPCSAVPPSEFVCNLNWVTTFVMQNLGTVDTTVTARFTSYDGAATATLLRTIAPGRSRFIDPSVEAQLAKGRYYAVTLTSAQPIAVIANAHDDAAGSPAPRAFSYNGIPQPAVGESFLPYVRRGGVSPRSIPGGVFIQNAGQSDATPTLTFQRLGGGAPLAISAPTPIKPGASWFFDPEVYAITGGYQLCAAAGPGKCIDPGEHSLIVSGGAFAVLDATLAPGAAMGYTGASGLGNRSYLPNVTRTLGGPNGWTTPIVLQSSGATNVTLRWYRFADGALIARQPVGPLTRGASLRVDPRSVPGLTDNTQYAVVVDAQGGNLAAIVTELNFLGGDGTMIYEGFPATVDPFPVPTAVTISPAGVTVGPGESAQLVGTVKDQFDNAMPAQPITWTVAPAGLATVNSSGVLTAGASAGTGTVMAASGLASATVPLTVAGPAVQTVGGLNFYVRATPTSDIYTETTITSVDAQTIVAQIDSDVAKIQQDYGRTYATRPRLYVMGTTSSYTFGQSSILGIPASSAARSAGVFSVSKLAVAIDWSVVRAAKPLMTPRHELTHWMIQQIAGPFTPIPAWFNEGAARLEQLTVPGSGWFAALNKYSAVSMAASNQLLPLSDITSQVSWNQRSGNQIVYQYYEASQAVQLVRDDIGRAGEIQILSRLGEGQTFEAAFQAVGGRTVDSFATTLPGRIQAVATSPGIAFAADTIVGTAGNGPTYVLYGYEPGTTVSLDISSASGFTNVDKSKVTDSLGVYWSYLSTSWPPDTYTFTATSSTGQVVTKTYTKNP